MKLELTITHMGDWAPETGFKNKTEVLQIDTQAIKYKEFAVLVNHLCLHWVNLVETTENEIVVWTANADRQKKEVIARYPFTSEKGVYTLQEEAVLDMIERFKFQGVKYESQTTSPL